MNGIKTVLSILAFLPSFLLAPLDSFAQDADKPAAPPVLAAKPGVPFKDNAILQQGIPLPVWGTSLPGASVIVSFNGQAKNTVADSNGKWRVVLDPVTAIKLKSVNQVPEAKTMTIVCEKAGDKAVTEIRNIAVGDVWICAGQSNMAGKIKTNRTRHYPTNTLELATYPALRQMAGDSWIVCSPDTAPEFKKVAFFFGRRLQKDALIPIGLIPTAVGGSKIETWLNMEPYKKGGNYAKLVEPLVGYGIRGVVWYQGESNANDKRGYLPKLRALILGWRRAWARAYGKPGCVFPFYFVQLPGIGTSSLDNPTGGDGRAEIRQAYFDALAITNTGMAITIDVGAVHEHPPNKYDTGVRLARLALHNDYGFNDLVPSGPLYKNFKVEGDSVRISFSNAQNGLMIAVKEGFPPPKPTPEAKLQWLSIQDQAGEWHWADGRIDGSELVVSFKGVKKPKAVRYGYTNHPRGYLLYNKDGLPASPFSTCGYDPAAE